MIRQRVMYASREGNGHQTATEAFPFQGVDIDTRPSNPWAAEIRRSADDKFFLQFTPFGTPVASLFRAGDDLLSVPCGNCGSALGRCRCSFSAL